MAFLWHQKFHIFEELFALFYMLKQCVIVLRWIYNKNNAIPSGNAWAIRIASSRFISESKRRAPYIIESAVSLNLTNLGKTDWFLNIIMVFCNLFCNFEIHFVKLLFLTCFLFCLLHSVIQNWRGEMLWLWTLIKSEWNCTMMGLCSSSGKMSASASQDLMIWEKWSMDLESWQWLSDIPFISESDV